MELDRDANNPTKIKDFAPQDETAKSRKHRLRRVSGKILGGEHRTAKCGCTRCAEVVTVGVNKHGSANFNGVSTCGSIWTCPVCASKIASKRSVEVKELASAHQKTGFQIYMATFTIRHGLGDDLRHLRTTLASAWDQLVRSAAHKRLKERFNIIGYVKALEVTHGRAGWHPHLHVLFFTRGLSEEAQEVDYKKDFDEVFEMHESQLHAENRQRKRDKEEIWSEDEIQAKLTCEAGVLQRDLFRRWRQIMKKRKFSVDFKAFDFVKADDAETAAEYISKWGAGTEIAKGVEKSGKGSRSPWELLDSAGHGDEVAAQLFDEYAKGFHRARHLTYARGLRDLYELEEEQTDEQLAMLDDAPEYEDGGEVYRFDKSTWSDVVRAKLTGPILDATEYAHEHDECEASAIQELLISHGLSPSDLKPDHSWKVPIGIKSRKPNPLPRQAGSITEEMRFLEETYQLKRTNPAEYHRQYGRKLNG